MPEITDEEIIRRCASRLGIEEDEIKVLYDDEEKRRDFYFKTVLKMKKVDNESDADKEEGKLKEDDYKLTADQKRELKEQKKTGKARRQAVKDAQQVDDVIQTAAGMADQSHLPDDEQVSLDDLLAEKRMMNEALSEDGDNPKKRKKS